jgi:hypothetical protein
MLLLRKDGDGFLSVYDSDNAALDTGELKDLALAASKILFRGILQTDGGLNASKMSLQWCRNVLRMVTPHMWICRTLLQQDRAALEAVAEVGEANDAFRIAPKEGSGVGRSRARPVARPAR